MIEAYARMTKERVFTERQLMLKATDHVRRGMAGPSKFSPKWEGPLGIRKTHASGYYHLAQMDGRDLMDPINGKWQKHYHPFCLMSFMFPFPSSDYVTRHDCNMLLLVCNEKV